MSAKTGLLKSTLKSGRTCSRRRGVLCWLNGSELNGTASRAASTHIKTPSCRPGSAVEQLYRPPPPLGDQGPGSLFAASAEAAASADRGRELRRLCYAQIARHAAGHHAQVIQRAANRMRSAQPAAKQARGLCRRGGSGGACVHNRSSSGMYIHIE